MAYPAQRSAEWDLDGREPGVLLEMVCVHLVLIEQLRIRNRGNGGRSGTVFVQGPLPHLCPCRSVPNMVDLCPVTQG